MKRGANKGKRRVKRGEGVKRGITKHVYSSTPVTLATQPMYHRMVWGMLSSIV